MPETYGYARPSRPRVSELSGSDPETQRQQLLAVGVALSHVYQGRRRLRNLRYQQPEGLALSGLPAGSRRHPGCGVHLAALSGHHGQHPRPATSRGDRRQLILPVASTVFASQKEVIIWCGGAD